MTTMSSGQSAIDKRIENRDSRFSGEYSCRLIPTDNRAQIVPIKPMDVSKRGLGFVAKEKLKSGAVYLLEVRDQRFRVEIAYCSGHLGIDNLYRCGLFLRDESGDISDTCKAAGLLSEKYHPLEP
jgi:hypothetical protein